LSNRLCALCEEKDETIGHIFLRCSVIRRV